MTSDTLSTNGYHDRDQGFVIDTPAGIEAYRLLARRGMLSLEVRGMRHSSGRSVYADIKREFNLHGSKASVLAQYEQILRDKGVLA